MSKLQVTLSILFIGVSRALIMLEYQAAGYLIFFLGTAVLLFSIAARLPEKEITFLRGRAHPKDAEAAPVPVATPAPEAPANAEILGLTVAPVDGAIITKLGLPVGSEGLIVMGVDQSSEAYAKGLREGDLITEAGQQKVVVLKDLEGRVDEARGAGRKSLLLLVRRDGDPRFVALSIE